jgi:hypothetical protein
MKLLITEDQYSKILSEYYEREKLYIRERIVNNLKHAPKYIRQYIKMLPHIPCMDKEGNEVICTKIPEALYQYLYGNF